MERSHPFDDPDWLFEPKYDGFRGIVYIAGTECVIRSKRGGAFKRFGSLAAELAKGERRGVGTAAGCWVSRVRAPPRRL